jgi:hypothetical protein
MRPHPRLARVRAAARGRRVPPGVGRAGRSPIGQRAHSALVQHLLPPGGGGGAGAPASPDVNPYDYSADAGYQRVRAIGQRDVGDAEAQALAARKQLAIDQGDPSLAPDAQTAAAASANPFSIMAGLAKHRAEDPRALTEADNSQNLFYSGAAAKHQSDLVRSLLESETNARAQGRSAASQIDSGLLQARQGAADQTAQAQEEAAGRLRDRLGDLPVGPQHAPSAGRTGSAPFAQSHIARAVHQHVLRPRRPRQAPARLPGHAYP